MRSLLRIVVSTGYVIGVLWWEQKRSLRPVVDNKLKRDVRNLAVASLAATVIQYLEAPLAIAIAKRAQRERCGLLSMMRAPESVKSLAGILLLDYTLYIWHRLTHGVPLLWRFHQVHHIDREMDASTAIRFHFGEMTLSVAFRAAQVWLIGPTPNTYRIWQRFLFACILFHHSNICLPLEWERRLAWILITPRLHGIHHSVVPEEVNSNWSSGLTIWDWLHATLRTDVPQGSIVIGVCGYRGDRDQQLKTALTLPFRAARVTVPSGQPIR